MRQRTIRPWDVVFAVTPFASPSFPAIGVSLLKAQLTRRGYRSRVRYFNLDFAQWLGTQPYGALAGPVGNAALLGEWVFAGLLSDEPQDEPWYAAQFRADFPGHTRLLNLAQQARACIPELIKRWADELLQLGPRVVGIPTAFQQNAAGLALARQLKRASRPPLVILGGANCLGDMGWGLLRAFPWIDYVCTGEADEVFPEFLRRLVADEDPTVVPGILRQGASALTVPPPVRQLDELPIPDYADYFRDLRRLPSAPALQPVLPIETARGCWWGEKHHCTFCSLWDHALEFRSKSARRAAEEFQALARQYRVRRFLCVDNIMDMRHIPALFERLAANRPALEIYYEVTANLRYDQLTTLRRGGVRWLQPGIESFSSRILRLMRKGCTAIQNLQLLRWTQELEIGVDWNLLFGFSGEEPADYDRMADLIPRIQHLVPPLDVVQVRLDRYSPTFNAPERFGVCDVRPSKYYAHVFSLPSEGLRRIAHFFDYDYVDGRNPLAYTERFRAACAHWQGLHRRANEDRPRLDAWDDGWAIRIEDTRPCAVQSEYCLTGLQAGVLRALDTGRSWERLRDTLRADTREGTLRNVLRRLVRSNLVIAWDRRYLALPVFQARPPTPGRKNPVPGDEPA
jgi:ribosomal peptide maturation radical SAM protein 1